MAADINFTQLNKHKTSRLLLLFSWSSFLDDFPKTLLKKYEVLMDPQFQQLRHLLHLEHNINFPSKSKSVIFSYFLMPLVGNSRKT